MRLICESRPGSLAPESVLLTLLLHFLMFIVDTAGLVSSLKVSSFKSLIRLDAKISLCVREDVVSSKGELVLVDPAPPALGYRVLWGQSASPEFATPYSLSLSKKGLEPLTASYLWDLHPKVRPCVPGSLNASECHPVGGMTEPQEACSVF